MQIAFVALAITIGVGCATGTDETSPPDPPPTEGDEVIGQDSAETQTSQLTTEQRAVLEPELRRYGSGWTLSEVEKEFTVSATPIADGYELHFVARGLSGLYSRPRIVIGGSFSGSNLHLPEGPELDAEQRAAVNAALRDTGEIWLLTRGQCTLLDTRGGLDPIVGADRVQTRLYDGRAVLLITREPHHDEFVMVVDLQRSRVVEAREVSLPPMADTRMMNAAEVELIDRALRTHGSFGVYGDVTMGLRALVEHFDVRINARTDGRYHMGVDPRDGHGHSLGFTIDPDTGSIDDMAAGHMVSPDW